MAEERRWNLSNIYPAVDSPEFTGALEKAGAMARELIATLKNSTAPDAGTLVSLIRRFEQLSDIAETLGAYAGACLSVNTEDKKALNAMNKVEELWVTFSDADVLFSNFIADNKDLVRSLCAKGGELEAYAFVAEKTIEGAAHQMSPELENLAADLGRSGCDAFSRLQEAVSSVATATLNGEKKTVIQLRTMATDPDRSVRKAAYDAEISVWRTHQTAFAAALNGVKGTCLSLEKRRGWNDPLERSAWIANVNMKVIDALIGAIEKNLPVFRRYLRAKAKALGLDVLSYWDIFAPVGKASRKWSFEEATEFIEKQYTAFNPEQGAFVHNAVKNNWIDPFPRPGKTGGAYDTYFPAVKESRVFANFGGDYDGVFTLAHELGHAWHDHVVSNCPSFLRNYPMTLAETASIFGEFIVFNGAVKQASDDAEKANLIENFLMGATQTCVDILARFYFERDLFKARAEGELVPEELCSMMVDAQKRAYGEGIAEETIHPYMWAVKGHYYSEGFSFYNYPYAFGQLFGLGLYVKAQESPDNRPFYEEFNRILSITGQYDAVTVAATAGCDIQSPEFWQKGLDVIAAYTDEFCKLVGSN